MVLKIRLHSLTKFNIRRNYFSFLRYYECTVTAMSITTRSAFQSSTRLLFSSLLAAAAAVRVQALVVPPINHFEHGLLLPHSRNQILNQNDEVVFRSQSWRFFSSPVGMVLRDAAPPDYTVMDDDDDDSENTIRPPLEKQLYKAEGKEEVNSNENIKGFEVKPKRKSREKISKNKMDGTSWVEKNAAFYNLNDDEDEGYSDESMNDRGAPKRKGRSFRQDFRGTRVFVKGIPENVSWQDLKDHFKVAGEVVFASVSVDTVTGESKGVGIVQFETSEMAETAIRIMRNHPLNGSTLYVREDVQEKRGEGGNQLTAATRNRRDTPPSHWECADDENSSVLSQEEREAVVDIIKARDAARRRRNYEESDEMRNKLKFEFGVHIDDRLKQWWVSFDGSHVPENVRAVKGEGRWAGKKAWRQIATTPENDACVNPDLVNGLLKQRDIARREKDFLTADALLGEARNAPDGDLYLRIHDESRTWRIWTPEPPRRPVTADNRKSAAEQCIELVREKAPHKEEEIRSLLQKFPGREYPILKKLRKSLADM